MTFRTRLSFDWLEARENPSTIPADPYSMPGYTPPTDPTATSPPAPPADPTTGGTTPAAPPADGTPDEGDDYNSVYKNSTLPYSMPGYPAPAP